MSIQPMQFTDSGLWLGRYDLSLPVRCTMSPHGVTDRGWGQVLTCAFLELSLQLWLGRYDLSFPVRCTMSPHGVTDGRAKMGTDNDFSFSSQQANGLTYALSRSVKS